MRNRLSLGIFAMTTVEAPIIGPDEKRRALEQVLTSIAFSRSDQLKRFLHYVCEKEIAGKTSDINECSIGIEALGKRAGYSPGDDSSVRTRAHALRQKLQEFYDTEQSGAELRIEMPKGCYTPHFVRHNAVIRLEVAEKTPFVGSTKKSPRKSAGAFVAGAIVASLFMGAIWIYTAHEKLVEPIDPIVREAWGQMLSRGEHVDVCIAGPPAMLLHSYKEGTLPTYPHYLAAPEEISPWYQGLQMMDGGGKLYMHTSQGVALFGDSLAAISAVGLLTSAGSVAQVVPEYNMQPYALRGRNVIMIGSPNYSPFAGRVLADAPFSVRYDPVSREEVISDNPTDKRRQLTFRPERDEYGKRSMAYGLVTVLPSQAGDGNAETVIFSGITAAGPQAAMEFFKSASDLRTLKLQFGAGKKFPPAYQVVVRCALDHNLALNWAYVTSRILKRSPL